MIGKIKAILVISFAIALNAQPAKLFAHGVVIGQDGAANLAVHVSIELPIEVPPSIYPGIEGFADVEPGITSAEVNDPDANLFLLDPASNIQIELVSADPGIQIISPTAWVPGQTFLFGPPFFDYHLVFNMPDGEFGTVYSVVLRLRDLNHIHAGSPEFVLSFTPVANICHCRGDIVEDESRDAVDVQSFVSCFMQGGSPVGECACADMNADGELNAVDVEMFVDEILDGHACHH